MFPRIARQAGFLAGVREERLAIPVPLGRHLRQQQPATPAALDDEPVAADLDSVSAAEPARADRAATARSSISAARTPIGGNRGSVLQAATAQRAITSPSGPSGSRCPMQPRSLPRLCRVTNAAPCRRAASHGSGPGAARTRDVRRDRLAREPQQQCRSASEVIRGRGATPPRASLCSFPLVESSSK